MLGAGFVDRQYEPAPELGGSDVTMGLFIVILRCLMAMWRGRAAALVRRLRPLVENACAGIAGAVPFLALWSDPSLGWSDAGMAVSPAQVHPAAGSGLTWRWPGMAASPGRCEHRWRGSMATSHGDRQAGTTHFALARA